MTVKPTTGGCLCGAVAYRIDGLLDPIIGCHCGQCRRTSGHYAASAEVSENDLTIADRENALIWYRSSEKAERGFCGHCGSNLFWRQTESGRVSVGAGSLNDTHDLQMNRHIFAQFKGDYYDIPEGAEVFPTDDTEPSI
ncbi:GFA family protein [Hwanghaeella grinnelliae]|uniref:GFA family protein n=1 Tax=Hwanghaeella grinnelliae TaxID=2500179 RepID=A0A437QTR5_9PROT|nr:GFA family protein [Hwanghaeella grinnelliae]RVU37883.1 GFA family protein [Hwanghaeella grinnelliae]